MRSLVLAGGGMKVAFQAGVLQVLLDEVGLHFDHVDACSGGAFNAAMLCEGRSGTAIADAWRALAPRHGVSVHARDLVRFPFGSSLVTLDGYRRRILPDWHLDWERIRASPTVGTFNAYDITAGRQRVFTQDEMDVDRLCACVGLPVWFPPVEIDGNLVTDAVFVTDADVDGAVERGADEIWVIWTVSRRREWMPGLMAQFFHTLEAAANGHVRRELDRIEASNQARRRGEPSRYDRHIEVHELNFEVPVHYLAVVGSDRLHLTVERGVAAARRWCRANGRAFTPVPARPAAPDPVRLSFQDTMHGVLATRPGVRSAPGEVEMTARLTLEIPDVDRFVTEPGHRAVVRGAVHSPLFTGVATVEEGHAAILVDDGDDPSRKQMRYRLHVRDAAHDQWTVLGLKTVDSGALRRMWGESTTLHTRVVAGWLPDDPEDPDGLDADRRGVPGRTGTEPIGGDVVAAGSVHLGPRDVARQVLSARAEGGDTRRRLAGQARFAGMFAGHLWDVYARRVLSYAPF